MEKSMSIKTLEVANIDFFIKWLVFLKPYHRLAPKQIRAVAIILYKRYQLSKVISDEEILDKTSFEEAKIELKNEMFSGNYHTFHNFLTSLRKTGVLTKDNKIIKGLIPNVYGNNFRLVLNFNIKWD